MALPQRGAKTSARVTPIEPWATHHVAIKVQNISRSIAFYTLLGFEEDVRFRAGPARASWLRPVPPVGAQGEHTEVTAGGQRLELIEVPPSFEPAPRGVDLSEPSRVAATGLNHLALDVTATARQVGGLGALLKELNESSEARFNRSVRLVVEPHQQTIGQEVSKGVCVGGLNSLVKLRCPSSSRFDRRISHFVYRYTSLRSYQIRTLFKLSFFPAAQLYRSQLTRPGRHERRSYRWDNPPRCFSGVFISTFHPGWCLVAGGPRS